MPSLPALILAVMRAKTPGAVAETLSTGLTTSATALCRVWLTVSSDRLLLAASTGSPVGGGSYRRIDGAFREIPWGTGKIGRIASTGAPLVVCGIRGDEEWLANPGWVARQSIRAFVGHPLAAGGQVYGVLARFDRVLPTGEALSELECAAACGGERLRALHERDALAARVAALERATALPAPAAAADDARRKESGSTGAIMTRADLRALEKRTIAAALEQAHGRIFGDGGAAAILGMKPTTLASRLKVLGIPSRRSRRVPPPSRPSP